MKFVRDPNGRHGESPRYAIGGLAGALTLAVLGVFTFAALDTYLLKSSSLAAVISAVLVDLTNGDRSGDNLAGLRVSPALTAAAQAKADDMALHSYFAHTSPDGKNSWYWFRQAGYTFLYAGENLAVDFSDSVDVENAWMNSPSHRENILNEHFTEIGIATAEGTYDGHPTTFVVQMFGTPATQTAPVVALASPEEPTEPALATTATTTKPVPKPAVKPSPKPSSTTPPKVALASSTAPTAASSTAATSTPVATTGPVVATLAQPSTQVLGSSADSVLPSGAGWWEHFLASPKTILTTIYGILAITILVLLAHATELEWHKKHLPHAVAAVLLVVFMGGLLIIAHFLFFSTPVLASVL